MSNFTSASPTTEIIFDGEVHEITPQQSIIPPNIAFPKDHTHNETPPDSSKGTSLGNTNARKRLFESDVSLQLFDDTVFIPLDEPVTMENILTASVEDKAKTDQSIEDENDLLDNPNDVDNEPEITFNSKRKRQNTPSEQPLTKKKKLNPTKWKAALAKQNYNSGVAHTTLRGKERAARKLKDGCGEKCRRQCQNKVSHKEREKLFKSYWGLKDKGLQWFFLAKLINTVNIKKRKIIPDDDPYRNHTYEYSLPDKNSKRVIVCQKMFLETFDISVRVAKTALSKNSPDKRGKHSNHKKLNPELISSVKNHIKSFPMIDSHYCRAESQRKYLDEHLSIAKMHRMYLIGKDKGDSSTASLRQYRDIFNSYFNLSFFKPKKDQCSDCAKWEQSSKDAESPLAVSHKLHLASKEHVRNLKTQDKIASRDTSSPNNSRVLTCDLQKVLYCPKSDLGEYFYKRKVSVFNFTVFDCTVKEGHLFVWDQTIGRRGSDEMTSFLNKFIESLIAKGIKTIIIYSDSCSGQNKNQFLYTMYYMVAMKYQVNIIHRYLEKGHTQNECDSVHARIEKKIKKEEIFVPSQYYGAMKTAKVKKPAYQVYEMQSSDIYSFRELAKFMKWSSIPVTKVREMNIGPVPGVVKYRLQWDEPLVEVNILCKKVGRPVNWETVKPPLAYSCPFQLKPKLKADLKWFMKKDFIPERFKTLYTKWIETTSQPFLHDDEYDDNEDDVPNEVVPDNNVINDLMERNYETIDMENADPFKGNDVNVNEDNEQRSEYNDSDENDSDLE
ncbi:putative ATP-dependent RNA helicase DHX34 [Frankliniella fusca]|uniref:ATP-dependent RNA helicase DHX34 n=1 Tax=Frankliniella fusca TaxID=407009 RepID=A0AAE1L8F3_9NEOP|nr:putative ATP-dependent RNA helicase DHX34 [Frankliniella fusca]